MLRQDSLWTANVVQKHGKKIMKIGQCWWWSRPGSPGGELVIRVFFVINPWIIKYKSDNSSELPIVDASSHLYNYKRVWLTICWSVIHPSVAQSSVRLSVNYPSVCWSVIRPSVGKLSVHLLVSHPFVCRSVIRPSVGQLSVRLLVSHPSVCRSVIRPALGRSVGYAFAK